jgi:glycosyltransferase involved in cell wall biosynthesis
MNLKFSIIICTKNRAKDLDTTLKSVFNQFNLPDSVIIVDDSHNFECSSILKKYESLSSVHCIYVHSHPANSGLPAARNCGIKKIPETTDIVLFLDDDVTLERNYLQSIGEIFDQLPEISGVSGGIKNGYYTKPWYIKIILGMIGWIIPTLVQATFYYPTVSRTADAMSPLFLKKNKDSVHAQWLSGCNMAYRSKIFWDGNIFDEQLVGYSLGEDMIFSHLLYKKGHQFAFSYKAQLTHRISQENRIPSNLFILIKIGYRLYAITLFSGNGIRGSLYYSIFVSRLILSSLILSLRYKENIGYAKQTLNAFKRVRPFERDIRDKKIQKFNEYYLKGQ